MQRAFPSKQPAQLWWGRKTGAARAGRAVAVGREAPDTTDLDADAGMGDVRNLYIPASRKDRFLAGGLISEVDGRVDREALHRLMRLLALRIGHTSPAGDSTAVNPGLPSGYTYLMQFIAHDLVDSVGSMRRDGAALRPTIRNSRSAVLMLDTLYGPGPEELPFAYAVSGTDAAAPRTRLRVGSVMPHTDGNATTHCPYRDVARAVTPGSDTLGESNRLLLTEACVADSRNDSHAFISQLTVLFQLLHNHVIDLLEQIPATGTPADDAQRRFMCARLVVTLIYRHIIENDLLPRILDDAVLERYRKLDKVLFTGDAGVPIEFTHGAFRYGHTIVRDRYLVRSEVVEEATFRALDFNALRLPQSLPLPENWLVDWARFFETAGPGTPGFKRNGSHVIGPHYPRSLLATVAFPRKSEIDGDGLANRDLLSAAYAGMLSARSLNDMMQPMFSGTIPPFAQREAEIRAWLDEAPGIGLEPDDVDRLSRDPPLPFFVQLEAEKAAQGRKLGPVGSVIVADTIFGALRSNPTGFEDKGSHLAGRIQAGAAAVYEAGREQAARAALAGIGDLTDMPRLLDYMATVGAFART